jgi:FlaA1/EpsC-like NDP-sugar epimerase
MPTLLGLNTLSFLAFVHDVLAVFAAWLLAYWLRLNLDIPDAFHAAMITAMLICIPIQVLAFRIFGLYRGVWRFASLPDLRRIVFAVAAGSLAGPFALTMLGQNAGVPRSVFLLEPLLLVLIMGGSRFAYRSWKEYRLFGALQTQGAPVLVIGTGDAAVTLVKELARSADWRVVALIDNAPLMRGRVMQEIRVAGGLADLAAAARRYGAAHAIIARPDATPRERREIVEACRAAQLQTLTVPAFDDLMSGKVQVSAIRKVELDDLLGRDAVVLDNAGLTQLLAGGTVMITGAGGSIGSELTRQIARFNPARLILIESSEFALYTINEELQRSAPGRAPACTIECAIADVRNAARIGSLMQKYRPSVVFHAAAYKHVPLMENTNAWEALTNNTLGTYVTARAAIAAGTAKFVLISTDKAVNPTNVMGASKRLAELVCQSLDAAASSTHSTPQSATRFITVRFGNVLGSTGSVIPKFREQIARGGPITVTHPDIVRYFMSIPEAAQLVLQAGLMGQGGEIFVLDMGDPVKITDLAREMIRLSGLSEDEIKIEFSGLRPGEKLFEELLADGESTLPTPHSKLRIARPGEPLAQGWIDPVLLWLRSAEAPDEATIKQELHRLIPEYVAQKPI